ncbi:zinc-ribbon domain-containing protein [Bacillus wiedmannii]|uniref:zinc-ribbon domain-containing protein n=1 Tax=Bacillus wiedmannii TaxID=1890302 RepID=UPI002E1B09BA|nr:zinc-ribbon domain-containing protein [Bacillus wiedmannii]
MSPKLAKEWHPTKNNKLTPNKISHSSNKRVWWLGKCGHEWGAKVKIRLKGNGCPKCYEATGKKIVHRCSLKNGSFS